MGKLIYITNVSLDGYIEDASGSFDFTTPQADFHLFITDLIRPVSTYLYGRRIYESMAVWETDPSLGDDEVMAQFADVWQNAEKIVYSTTLDDVWTSRTRLERDFDPDTIRAMKESSDGDLTVAGAALAAHAFKAGLVDEVQLFVSPVAVGSGKPGLPQDLRLNLELLDERLFSGGVVYLRYGVKA